MLLQEKLEAEERSRVDLQLEIDHLVSFPIIF